MAKALALACFRVEPQATGTSTVWKFYSGGSGAGRHCSYLASNPKELNFWRKL